MKRYFILISAILVACTPAAKNKISFKDNINCVEFHIEADEKLTQKVNKAYRSLYSHFENASEVDYCERESYAAVCEVDTSAEFSKDFNYSIKEMSITRFTYFGDTKEGRAICLERKGQLTVIKEQSKPQKTIDPSPLSI